MKMLTFTTHYTKRYLLAELWQTEKLWMSLDSWKDSECFCLSPMCYLLDVIEPNVDVIAVRSIH